MAANHRLRRDEKFRVYSRTLSELIGDCASSRRSKGDPTKNSTALSSRVPGAAIYVCVCKRESVKSRLLRQILVGARQQMPFCWPISGQSGDISPSFDLRAEASLSIQRSVFCPRKALAHLNNTSQLWKQRVFLIRTVKPVITIRPAGHEANRVEFTQLVLNSAKGEAAQAH